MENYEKKKRRFFKILDFTAGWLHSKVNTLAAAASHVSLKKGECMATFGYIKLDLYDLGDESDKLYFISKGELKKSVAVELKAHNRYPVGKAKWEVLTTTRKVLKEVGVLSPKDVVGQEELRTDGKRSHRVEATMDSRVYFITRTVYNKLFMDSEKEWLEQNAVKSLPPFKEAEGLSSNEYEMKFKVLK